MLLHFGFGLLAAGAAAVMATGIARRRYRHPAAAYGVAALFLNGIAYIALLQTAFLHLRPESIGMGDFPPATLYIAYSAACAAASVLLTIGLVSGFTAIQRPATGESGRIAPYARVALFATVVMIIAAPFLVQNQLAIGRAAAANNAEIAALRTSYKAGLDRLVKLGVVRRIEVDDETVTHYVSEPLFALGPQRLAEYARASMIYQSYVSGQTPKPVVLRNAENDSKIGTYRTDGVFVLEAGFSRLQ